MSQNQYYIQPSVTRTNTVLISVYNYKDSKSQLICRQMSQILIMLNFFNKLDVQRKSYFSFYIEDIVPFFKYKRIPSETRKGRKVRKKRM